MKIYISSPTLSMQGILRYITIDQKIIKLEINQFCRFGRYLIRCWFPDQTCQC